MVTAGVVSVSAGVVAGAVSDDAVYLFFTPLHE
jgi:hypothetical protein